MMTEPAVQSDDCYSRISFMARDGSAAEGTLGWREGAENRVVFQVWDGPSFAGVGDDLAAAFAAARKGIMRAGFTPQAAGDGGLDDLFARIEAPSPARFQPVLWLLVAAILLALLIPAIARAEAPEWGKRNPFPNAEYDWRYEGANYDARARDKHSVPRLRAEARGRGDPNWRRISLEPSIITVTRHASNKRIARYRLEGGQFCEGEEGNCAIDGIFPLVVSSLADEPVLVVVRHIGAHGQRLAILRPLKDPKAPVFEAWADYALSLRLFADRLDITVDRALDGGGARQEHLHWPARPTAAQQAAPPAITLPRPPPLTTPADAFDKSLHAIVASRDLDAFMALLSDDALVSFGGSGGKAEFARYWHLDTQPDGELLWHTLDRLLAHGGWNEAGSERDDEEAGFPQRMTWPWFFTAWPDDADAENVFIAQEDTPLRATLDASAPVLARLPGGAVLHGRIEEGEEWHEWVGHGMLEVVAPDGGLGFVAQEDIVPLLEARMVAGETATGWQIEALVAGD